MKQSMQSRWTLGRRHGLGGPLPGNSSRRPRSRGLGWFAVLAVALSGAGGWTQSASPLGKVVPLSSNVAHMFAPATGIIMSAREKPFTVGDRVKKGEPLAIIFNRYDLHDAAHISNIRWDFLGQMMETRYA